MTRRSQRLIKWGMSLVLAIGVLQGVAHGTFQQPGESAVDAAYRLIAELGDDSYLVRERATDALKTLHCPESILHDMLASNSLSLEQRSRLLEIATRRLIDMPRGALGIRMRNHAAGPAEQPFEVEIIGWVEGMPAEGVLRLGDRITHVDGTRLHDDRDLRTLVQSHLPGETVLLSIRRPLSAPDGAALRDAEGRQRFEKLEIPLELGSVDTLTEHDDGRASRESEVLRQRHRAAEELSRTYRPPTPHVRFGER